MKKNFIGSTAAENSLASVNCRNSPAIDALSRGGAQRIGSAARPIQTGRGYGDSHGLLRAPVTPNNHRIGNHSQRKNKTTAIGPPSQNLSESEIKHL